MRGARFLNVFFMFAAVWLCDGAAIAYAGAMTIEGKPPTTVIVGQTYSFKPSVANANTSKLEFGYVNLPGWSKHYRGSGLIRGTPTAPGVFANIQITAWDGAHAAQFGPFTITVLSATAAVPAVALPLVISGAAPLTAKIATYYSFTPTVVASAGARLTYSIQNKPAWAQFSAATGGLSGTPVAANAGADTNIVVSVTNGVSSAVLAPFSIEVTAAVSGLASLSWMKPTQNTNGSSLTNLVGYIIRYGQSATALNKTISIGSANATSATIENLSSGAWFFEIAALNSSSVESQFSPLVSKTF